MTDPWFPADAAPLFALLSFLALLSLLQPAAAGGRARALVLGCYFGATALGLMLAVAGAIAMLVGQPDYVSTTLLLAGGITFVLMLYYDWRIVRLYRRAELHRSVASDL